jgi:hypothetical protein
MIIQKKMHMRGFISLLTALSFLIMTISGVILFVVPQGRIALWVDWRMLGLTKSQWGDMHITTSLLFALAGLWHTWLNWRALLSYFRDKAKKTIALKWELAVATVLTIFFTVGAVYKTPPLNYILDFNDAIKEYWIKGPDDEPPIQHAELLPLNGFLKKVDLELAPALKLLEQNNIKITGPDQKFGDIANTNGTSPANIYKLLRQLERPSSEAAKTPSPATEKTSSAAQPSTATSVKRWTPEFIQTQFEGKGIGRKTLTDICTEFKLDQATVSKKLAAKKITMAPDDTLKEIGTKYNELPVEIMKIILAGEEIK